MFTKNKLFKNMISSAEYLIFPITMLFLLGPAEVFYSNYNEFAFSFWDFAPIFIVISIATLIIGSFILSILPKKISICLCGLIFSGSLAMYLQNLLLNKNIFNNDGSPVDWSQFKIYSFINIIIWLLIIFLGTFLIIKNTKVYSVIKKISLFMGVYLLLSYLLIMVSCILHPKTYIDIHYTYSGKDQLKYGKENIIVVVLDHYANTEFESLLYSVDKDSVEALLHDFTYYDNANNNYNYTFPSIPSMLTGEKIDPNLTWDEWTSKVWSTERCNNFYDKMHDAGYTCCIYSEDGGYNVYGNIKNLDGKFDNIIKDDPYIDYRLMCVLLEKNSLYKYAPYYAKPRLEVASYAYKDTFIFRDEDGINAYQNDKFYKRLTNEGLSVDETTEKKYTFMHLYGMHAPYNTGVNGEFVEETTPDVTARGLHTIMTEYISQLKQLGIYDSSTIIIMSDHGSAYNKSNPQPIFFIKKPYENHKNMVINSAPISYDDYLATILEVAGLDYSNYGKTIFDWNENDSRVRELWYPGDGYDVYTYDGDRDVLIEKLKNKDCKHVNSKLKDVWH